MFNILRYFENPKLTTSSSLTPIVPVDELKKFINRLIGLIENHILPIEKNARDGVYLGTAGISYMYYHLSCSETSTEQKQMYLSKAVEYIEPAIKIAEVNVKYNEPIAAKDAPSFMLGHAGVYAVATAIYQSVNNMEKSTYYLNQFHSLAKYCKKENFLRCGSDELFVGRAGYILGSLWLSKVTNTALQKHDVYDLCKLILKSGREYAAKNRKVICPLMYSYYNDEYLGAAHGLSGILQSLISVPGFCDTNPTDKMDIKTSIDYLLSLENYEANFPAMTEENKNDAILIHWCHGAGGIFFLVAKAYLVFKDEKYLALCKRIATLIWKKGLLKKGPGLCHGVAGNGYVLLTMYRLTGDSMYLSKAIYFYKFLTTDEFQKYTNTPSKPYSLFEGLAGTVCYLSDLMNPQHATFPFFDIFP